MIPIRKSNSWVGGEHDPANFTPDKTTTPTTHPHLWSTFDAAVVGYCQRWEEDQAKVAIPAYEFTDEAWWVLNEDVIRWYVTVLPAEEALHAAARIENESWRIRQRDDRA